MKRSSRYLAQPGTLGACLKTTTLPAMSVGTAIRTTCHKGKFQGITAKMGPIGSKRTPLRRPFVGSGSSWSMDSVCSA